jgi:hypothetical protein
LGIKCQDLTEALGAALSNCFPDLVTLCLEADISEHIDINIQSPDFKKATFINPMKYSEGCVFIVKSASQTILEEYFWRLDGIMFLENMDVLRDPCLTFTSAVDTKSVVLDNNNQAIWIKALGSN